jgi:SecD/SecF fusion protein
VAIKGIDMDRNLTWKIVLIVGLVLFAAWVLYPPDKTLKPGIDLGGGTSLIYEIDAKGLSAGEKKGLAERMITVLRRRIDPANIQNLVWRPQGSTRFEIQMPLSSKEARDKRAAYERVLSELLNQNVTTAAIMRSVEKPAEQRTKDFERFAQDSNDRMQILDEFAKVHDERKELQKQRDELDAQKTDSENKIKLAGLDLDEVQSRVVNWAKLDIDKLKEALLEYLGSKQTNLDLLTQYTEIHGKWAQVVEKLTDPLTGANIRYNQVIASLHKLNLSEDQINAVLDVAAPGSVKRDKAVGELKTEFPEREDKIDRLVKAYDAYYPFRGRLDDPGDLQRMLKGAGILEFRILPTEGHPDVDMAQMKNYKETLKTKGPRYASDDKYVWEEVEDPQHFRSTDGAGRPVIMAPFGNKVYVLASSKKDEAMLHTGQAKEWKLNTASAGQDQQGRRAIDFELDDRGGRLFSIVTGKNLERPLCILLDNMAISAPKIQSKIYTRGQITGNYTTTEVQDMVSKLNAGSLPARLIEQPILVKTIGPSIGADNRDKGIKAGLIGLAGVLLAMLIYYMKAGSIADVALLMNLLFTMAIMAGLRATFTMAGIAGVILTIGMSIDANVLIFERIREEQHKGASLAIAIKNGYAKAFSAIFDSNLTTILTAAILYWVASEEIKGFALTLILGLASSMFTALFVTRVAFDLLLKHKFIKDHLMMLHLIKKPNINWMKYLPVFLVFSAILTIGGLTLFFTRDETKNPKYDIEFTGGTSVQVNLRDGVNLTREQVEDGIHRLGEERGNNAIASASVYSVGKSGRQYEITTTETNKTIATVVLPGAGWTPEKVIAAIQKAQKSQQAELGKLVVKASDSAGQSFNIRTSQLNTQLVGDVLRSAFPDANISDTKVDEVVTNVVLAAFENQLEVQQTLQPKIAGTDKITESMVETHPELADFLGGSAIKCELGRDASAAQIDQRLRDLRFKPEARDIIWYPYKLLDTGLQTVEPNQVLRSFIYVSAPPEAIGGQVNEDVWARFVDNETAKVTGAMNIETSLPQVTQISPSVGAQAKTQALVAIVLSLIAMLIYLGVRFGDVRYGLGGIITLAHDTTATLGAVMCCAFVSTTFIGQKLLIGDFKIDMAMVGAFLTLLGYSINDSIVIYDRIRENRRKGTLTPQLINNSINECMSRTLLTGTTTLLVVLVMYIFGGKGLRGFNFALLFGIIEGTYSSIAISAPILMIRAKSALKSQNKPAEPRPNLQPAK